MSQSQTINQMAIDQAVILNKITNIESRVTSIEKKLDSDYVTRDQFVPYRSIVGGLVGLALTAVAVAIVNLVIK